MASFYVVTSLLFLVTTVSGKAYLSLRFVRFDNPGGKGDNGHCCDGRSIFCPSRCDHRFVVCLDWRYGRRDTSSCPLGKKLTSEIQDQDSIVFGSRVGGVPNPMVFEFFVWPGEVRVKIGVWDKDDNNDDLVDFLTQDISTSPSRNAYVARAQRISVRDRVTLYMDVKVYCGAGSYGSRCGVTCEPKQDNTTGYTCDRITGRKICLDGWTGRNCDVSVNDCVINRCEHGATCVDGHRNYTCVCAPGYTGQFCADEINECHSSPCQNNGTCLDGVNSFTCVCDPKWTGVTCQTRDACSEVTCANGGTCFNFNHSFVCKCPKGFADETCQTNIDECQSNPCQNGGTCTDLIAAFQCTCSAGWTGETCDTDVDECADNPCVNASQCQNLLDDFACVCQTGFTGKRCDTDINECLKQPCQNGGQCTNEEPGFQCACLSGYHGDTCQHDVDECAMSPCSENATCANVPGSYSCICPPDFTGHTCDSQIDDCQGQVCEHNGTCIDGINDFRCACIEQYTGRKCGVYIDRCLATPCQNGGKCRDPGYGQQLQCRCREGWQGPLCSDDIDECLQEPCANGAKCINTPGGFSCRCSDGWTGVLCQEDINECRLMVNRETKQSQTVNTSSFSLDLSPEPPRDQTWCEHEGLCVNVDGLFLCVCREGWQGERCQDDVNECSRTPQPCQNEGQCINSAGSYQCTCPEGSWSGKLCDTDVDECQLSPCNAPAKCVNSLGGFNCVCPQGWQGENCDEDVDECLGDVIAFSCGPDDGNCTTSVGFPCPANASCDNSLASPCQNNASCQNTAGGFACLCAPGWRGMWCEEDIDECTVGVRHEVSTNDFPDTTKSLDESRAASTPNSIWTTSSSSQVTTAATTDEACFNRGVCQNVAGSFSCACAPQWSGPRCQTDVNECREGSNPCQNQGRCSNHPGGFSCACQGPWEGELCSVERDECKDKPCEHNGTCIRRSATEGGGVQCVCQRGWRGPLCGQDRNECDLQPCLSGGTCVNVEGSFRCLCPENATGSTCNNDTTFDAGVSLPLYLRGYLEPEDENKVKKGIKVYLEQHGDFRHDVSIRAYLQTHKTSVGIEKIAATKVSVTVTVENVTLSTDEVTEIFNRVPPWKLQLYLPSPLLSQEVEEHVTVGHSRQRQAAWSVPWYVVVGGAVGVAVLTAVAFFLFRRKGTVIWRPRKQSDTTVMFSSHNGGSHSGSRSSSLDLQGTEYVNTLPRNDAVPHTGCSPPRSLPDPGQSSVSALGVDRRETQGSQVPCATCQQRSSACCAVEPPFCDSRAEMVWWSRPKEVLLRPQSECNHGALPQTPETNSRLSCSASTERSASEEEPESRSFVNTVYMTIPPTALGVIYLPPDPNRGALPPPPDSLTSPPAAVTPSPSDCDPPLSDYDVMAD